MRLFLIGMPGSGKSTLGKQLAKDLQFSFIDMDEQIVKKENRSIEAIFSIHGESYFRERERDVLHEICNQDDIVVSSGGGAPCFYDNIDVMNKAGITIYLNVPLETLSERVTNTKGNIRPMVAGKTKDEAFTVLSEKLRQREVFYSKAKHIISGPSIQASEILGKIK